MSSFLDIQNQVILLGNLNEVDRAAVKYAVNAAVQELCQERGWSWLESQQPITLLAGTNIVSVGQDIGLGRIQTASKGGQNVYVPEFVEYRSPDPDVDWVRDASVATVGEPTLYTQFGGDLYFNAIPQMNIDYLIVSWLNPLYMSGDSDVLMSPAWADEAVVMGALHRIALKDHSPQFASIFRQRYQELVAQLARLDTTKAGTVKVPMSGRYEETDVLY